MPRGRCHFALLVALQHRLEAQMPDLAAMTLRNFPDFLAGSLAPDAMRSLGRMGKFRTHFYEESERETWGCSVSGMFEAHPDLASPEDLSERDRALVMGYISHLTADEAFRDNVTVHVYGIELWRPIIRGLWSRIDELAIAHPDLPAVIDAFDRTDAVGFIDCATVQTFLMRARPWAVSDDPWINERVFLRMIGSDTPDAEARAQLDDARTQAARFLDGERQQAFVADALDRAFVDVCRFIDGKFGRGATG